MVNIYEISILRIINSNNIEINQQNNNKIYNVVKFNGSHYELISNSITYSQDIINKPSNIKVVLEDGSFEDTIKKLLYKVQKEFLNPMETAFIYKEICEFTNVNQNILSKKVNKTQGAISNKLRLLKLPTYIQNEIIKNNLKERHGRALLQLTENNIDKDIILNLVKLTIQNSWKVKTLENEIDLILGKEKLNKNQYSNLGNKRNLKNREMILSINQLEKDIDNSINLIKELLPNTNILVQKGILNDDYVINISLKDINKEV